MAFTTAVGVTVHVSPPEERIPWYQPHPWPMIYLPRPQYFESDNALWHTVMHEAAHHLHFIKYGHITELVRIGGDPSANSGPQWLARALAEVVADSAAYVAVATLGIAPELQAARSRYFIANWASQRREAGLPVMSSRDVAIMLNIAHDLISIYKETVK